MSSEKPEKTFTPTVKAYKNTDFLNSEEARNIRIMCEYEETFQRLKRNNIKATVLFFGSARSKSHAQYQELKEKLEKTRDAYMKGESVEAQLDHRLAHSGGHGIDAINAQLERLEAGKWMCDYYEKCTELARLLTEWAMSPGIHLASGRRISGVSRYSSQDLTASAETAPAPTAAEEIEQSFVIGTGGGPGFMEAANKGAAMVAGAKTIGMGISLPFENKVNKYVTDDLAFQFHYFFTRKFWMVYHCQALVVAPGGVGTMDELFEVLTLKQTGKVQKDLPVVLLGETYWRTIINWQALVDHGVVAAKDYSDLFFTDSAEDAFRFLTQKLQCNPIFYVQEADDYVVS